MSTPSKNNPALKNAGYGMIVPLYNAVSVVTAAANGLASFILPAIAAGVALAQGLNKNGHPLRVGLVQFSIDKLGTGASSGSFTMKLTRVSDGVAVATGVIAYNAASPVVLVDARDASGNGVYVPAGDTLRLDVTGVPPSVAAAQGFKALCLCAQYGVGF